jgi:hypothetical protein
VDGAAEGEGAVAGGATDVEGAIVLVSVEAGSRAGVGGVAASVPVVVGSVGA